MPDEVPPSEEDFWFRKAITDRLDQHAEQLNTHAVALVDIGKTLNKIMIDIEGFQPVKKVVYAACAMMLAAMVTAIIGLVIVRGHV